jgi:DNA-directed RNA polymerase subunit RPC12/RpoP
MSDAQQLSPHPDAPISAAPTPNELRCPRCEKRSEMRIIAPATSPRYSPMLQFLVRVFSPGGVEINQHYRCPRCGHEFKDMSLLEALIAPATMIALVVLNMLLFLFFIFFKVAPK